MERDVPPQGEQDCQLTHQLGFCDSLNGQSKGLFAAFGQTDQCPGLRIKTKGDTRLVQIASRDSIDRPLSQRIHSSERHGTIGA